MGHSQAKHQKDFDLFYYYDSTGALNCESQEVTSVSCSGRKHSELINFSSCTYCTHYAHKPTHQVPPGTESGTVVDTLRANLSLWPNDNLITLASLEYLIVSH